MGVLVPPEFDNFKYITTRHINDIKRWWVILTYRYMVFKFGAIPISCS